MKKISILIITYNRVFDLLQLLNSIRNLNDLEKYLEEVVIINNFSEDNFMVIEDFIKSNLHINIKLVHSDKNLGVSKGRNEATKIAQGKYLFFLDDDTELITPKTLFNIINIFENSSNKNIGIATVQIKYFETLNQQITAFPHKNFKKYKDYIFFETSFYVGCAHIIKRDIFDKIGFLPEDFFYGMEEYDLGYRAINAGYSIVYDNQITVLHKESPLGRKPRTEVLMMMWINKTKVAYKYLPKKYYYSTLILWSLFFLKETKYNLREFFKGYKNIFKINYKNLEKKPISSHAINYIHKVGGRLWY